MSCEIAIIMGTFNGAKYLKEQLDSIVNQTYKNWTLYITDDGSTDETLKIIAEYQTKINNKIFLFNGPRKGFSENFLSLLNSDQISSDYFAFSDQDDIWLPTKLSHSLNIISKYGQDIPALYGSRAIIVDELNHQKCISISTNLYPPCFTNALIQSFCTGNTMFFNNPAREVIRVGHNLNTVAHDWWSYLMVTGSGGHVYNDPQPTLRYRQHEKNVIGFKAPLGLRLKRIYTGFNRNKISQHIDALSHCTNLLTESNYTIYEEFRKFHNGIGIINGIKFIKNNKLYELHCKGQLRLYLKYFLKML
jgi:glycosyltransferase involved in cell wall biosynthesis